MIRGSVFFAMRMAARSGAVPARSAAWTTRGAGSGTALAGLSGRGAWRLAGRCFGVVFWVEPGCCWACGVVFFGCVAWCFFGPGAVARLAAFAPVCAGLPGVLLRAAWRFWRVLGAFLVHRVFSSRVVSVQI